MNHLKSAAIALGCLVVCFSGAETSSAGDGPQLVIEGEVTAILEKYPLELRVSVHLGPEQVTYVVVLTETTKIDGVVGGRADFHLRERVRVSGVQQDDQSILAEEIERR